MRPPQMDSNEQPAKRELYLAPLADYTDAPFRALALECGASGTYTEMVSAAALAHSHRPSEILLSTMPEESASPPVCQLFGASESELAKAVRVVSRHAERYSALNLNAGCPMPKVVKTGAGARLAADPAKVHSLLAAMRENTSLPLTLKTRLGPREDTVTIHELIDAAASAGACAVVVHARFTSQRHSGPVHLDILADAVARSPLPVVGNGSIADEASAADMAATGVAGIMIGRAALGNPRIFAALAGGAPAPGGMEERMPLFLRHIELLESFHAQLSRELAGVRIPALEDFLLLKARTHLFRYFSGVPGAAALRARFNSARSMHDLLAQ